MFASGCNSLSDFRPRLERYFAHNVSASSFSGHGQALFGPEKDRTGYGVEPCMVQRHTASYSRFEFYREALKNVPKLAPTFLMNTIV